MDIGTLIAKPQQLRIWIITPVVIILLLGASSGTFRNYKVNVLAEQEKIYRVIPQMEKTLQGAQEIIQEFETQNKSGIGPGNELLASANRAAEKEQFNLTSAAVDMNLIEADGPIMELEATLLGEGTLTSIIKFMDTLISEQRLLSEKEFQLALMQNKEGRYSAKLVFSRMALQNGKTEK